MRGQLMHRWRLKDNPAHATVMKLGRQLNTLLWTVQEVFSHISHFQGNMKDITELTKEIVDWVTNLDINL